MNPDIARLVYTYGENVAHRERIANDTRYEYTFRELNRRCGRLWHALIEAGCYEDAEYSRLKPKWVAYYQAGLSGTAFAEVGG